MSEAPSPPIPLGKGHHPHVRKLQEPFWLLKAKEKNITRTQVAGKEPKSW